MRAGTGVNCRSLCRTACGERHLPQSGVPQAGPLRFHQDTHDRSRQCASFPAKRWSA